jgi:hypothetical protein
MHYISLFCPVTYAESLHTRLYFKSLSAYTKNKKLCIAEKKIYEENGIFAFFKKLALQKFFIFFLLLVYVISKMMHEKKFRVTVLFFQLHKEISFRS